MSEQGTGPTLKDLGDELGISATAVSLALNHRPGVGDDLRRRVLTLAAKRGYRPNFAARALRVERSSMIGLVNRNLHNPGFLGLFDGFRQVCVEHGFQVMVGASDLDPHGETALIDAIAAHRLDGLAIAPIEVDAVLAAWRRRADRPLVLLNSGITPPSPDTLSVQADGPRAVRLALDHLFGLGHRRIALLTHHGLKSGSVRVEEFAGRMRRHRLHPRVIETTGLSDTVDRVVRRLKHSARPTAIITDSDALAHQVYRAAALVGLTIPDQLAVVGHDDLPTSELLGPPLTTIAVDRGELGRAAARMLIGSINGDRPADRDRRIPVELRIRASTAPPAPS